MDTDNPAPPPPPFPAAFHTYFIILSENERGQEVPPDGGRLEHEEEDAKVLVDDVRAAFAFRGGLSVPRDGQVRALGRPEGGSAQTQHDRGGHESVPEGETATAFTLLGTAGWLKDAGVTIQGRGSRASRRRNRPSPRQRTTCSPGF